MGVSAEKSGEKRRRESAGVRREQLITATLKCIANHGIIGTTLALVAGEAGLSQGIVNLHFKSKDNLLNESLAYLADEYMTLVAQHLDRAGESAVERLRAIVDVDFSPAVFNRRKIAVWYAFQGEAKSRPTYRKICRVRDDELDHMMLDVISVVVRDGEYHDVDPQVVSDTLSAISNGVWLSYLINPREWSAARARKAAFSYLRSVFPKEFGSQSF